MLELADLAKARDATRGTLNEEETKWVVARDIEDKPPLLDKPSENLQNYLAIDEDIISLSTLLRDQEIEKIRRALAALDDWLPTQLTCSFTSSPQSASRDECGTALACLRSCPP